MRQGIYELVAYKVGVFAMWERREEQGREI
jgi:hypothetical protein